MHYFKNKFAKMDIDLDGDGQKESYELWMDDPEYKAYFKCLTGHTSGTDFDATEQANWQKLEAYEYFDTADALGMLVEVKEQY